MNKFWPDVYPTWDADKGVFHREIGDIPGTIPAKDIFVIEDGHFVLKNPSKPYRSEYL